MNAKILIADDESDIVSMLDNFFESKGFRVLPAFNGAEALKQVEKQPDIILLDINMPGTDGLEVCKRIRDHISCPILFLTARIEDTDKVKGFAVGGDDYIVKPFSLVELDARVRAHLRREARHNFEAQIKFVGDLTIDYVLRQLLHPGITLHLGTDEVEHLVVPALQMQRFVLQLTDEIEHQPVQIRINRQSGNLIQPLAGQCQIGVAVGIEQLLFIKSQFHRRVPSYQKRGCRVQTRCNEKTALQSRRAVRDAILYQTKISSDLMISSARFRMLFIRSTHSS